MHLKHYFAKFLLSTLIVCSCLISNGQQIIQQKISQQFATAQNIATYNPLSIVEANTLKSSIPKTLLSKKQFFQIQSQQFQSIKEANAQQLIVSLPIEGQQVEFQLLQADILSDDFQAVAASGALISQDMGAHYWGAATSDANSFAAFSFLNNELIGSIHLGGKAYTLGKMKNSDTHILYNNADLKSDIEYDCQELLPPGMSESDMPPIDAQPLSSSTTNCINIHMEVDHSIYLAANSDADIASNYIAGVFSQVAALYINENINVQISYLQVWDIASPYGNGTELEDLVAQGYGKTHGDLVHIVHLNGVRGLAYRDVICNSFVNTAASGLQGSYEQIPTFSWDVEVITHEIGHNLGSPHTHGCYWNGNNTAIDGCGTAAGFGEGCDAALPTSGTIMSYCHLLGDIGIDFNIGFGQQPGDLIRSRVNGAFCLTECTACTPGDACDDGDACTINDVLEEDCGCAGTFADADDDGVCDANDICEFGDDNLDTDGDGTPDACDFSDASDPEAVYSLSFSVAEVDCQNQTINVDFAVQATHANLGFDIAEQNYRMSFDKAIANPVIVQELGLSGVYPLPNNEFALYSPHSLLGSMDTVLSYNIALQSSNGFPVGTTPIPVGRLGFDIIDGSECFDIKWHTQDIYPSTVIVEEADGALIPIINGGSFTDITICLDDYCPTCDVGATCDDGDDCTLNDVINENCECAGTFADSDQDGVCDANDICPDFNDELIGTACDDGDACTIQDIYNENCECAGTYADSDQDGICDAEDICPDFNDELIGTACDDGDDCTVNDTYINCECVGVLLDADEDGVCDANDICPDFNDELIGTACDDGDACTIQDIYNENCECAGTYADSDQDGICDAEDICPDFNDELIGTACDDGDDCTVNDTYINCECVGVFLDADEDGVCDANDICPDFNDELIGTACDDGSACTINDVYTSNCECEGVFPVIDSPSTLVLEPVHDAYLQNGIRYNNNILRAESGKRVSYIMFDLSAVNGTIATADLELTVHNDAGNGDISIEQGDNNNWTETNLSTNNKPNPSTLLGQFTGNYSAQTTYSTSLSGITAANLLTLIVTHVDGNDVSFKSKENAGATPQLTLTIEENTSTSVCDDGNPCTINDTYDENCNCIGTYVDSDEDGACDAEDICPVLNNSLIGTPCDDSDACTTGDIYTPNCDCAGTFADGDADGICDAEDICEFGDDSLDSDGDGTPDACDFFNDTDSDGDGVPDSEDICPGGDDNIDSDGNGTPDACEDCPTFNFMDYPIGTYGNNQDKGTVTTSAEGTTIELNDNAWKAITVDYEITPYTIIEFDFKSTQIGEIHGVGFDNNTSISSGRTFKLYGTQNWGNSTFNDYSGSGEYEHFMIPVGEFYTGQAEYFFFVSDHDAAPNNGNSFFANLKIYEDANGDGLCDSPDDCADADGDTVCDNDDICPAGDDTIDTDGDGTPDACDLCPNDANNACDTTPDYCESTAFNTNYEYIDRVIFGNIDNTSGNNGGYGDFSNQVVTVGLGDIVPLALMPGFSGSPYNEAWRVWIDFNQDGDFDDSGERVFSGNGAGILSSNIEIPADAALGLTGMRVSMRWNRLMNPCSDFAYGEVEDYTVNITAESQNYTPLDLREDEFLVESPAIRIFPNPATEYININFQNIREGASIAIYSTSGQLIGTQIINAEHLYIPLNHLPAGVYILHLRYGDDTYATERFVKISE